MKNLLKKFRENKKGFTLAELLVVVAIVGILVAISIPVFTAQLSKARLATNQANIRAAKAAAVAEYLSEEKEGTVTYDYNTTSGKVEKVTTGSASVEKDLDSTTGTKEVTGDKKYTKFSVKISAAANGGSEVQIYAEKGNTIRS